MVPLTSTSSPCVDSFGPGHFPPSRHRHSFPEDHDHWDTDSHYIKHYNPEAIARVKGVRKPNLLGQVIPVYGFGIFLYILYLFFKLTCKDKPHQQECRFPMLQSECTFEEMPTCQLVQLQARMSEKVREKRISKVVHPSARSRRGTRRREERKLKQLKEITQMMKERQLREGATPEEEAEEAPYTADWEGYPDETYPEFDMTSRRRRFPSVILEEPDQTIPTAEELAERMEKEEEDELVDDARGNEEVNMESNEGEKEEEDEEDDDEEEDDEEEEDEEEVREDQPCLPKEIDEDDDRLECPSEGEEKQKPSRRRQITFSDHRHVFHYPKGGAVGCKYEKEEEEEHEREEEEEENEEEETIEEDSEEEETGEEDCEEEENGDEEEGDQRNEERQGETEEKEEDPLMEAESLGFNDDVECDPEEQEVDLLDFLQSYQPEVTVISNRSESPEDQASGTLRMRHKRQKVKK
ncbi:protein RIC-3 isoform X2 [Rhinichthys klamathensis goyatoka]|uniref:protein RIC-3 isoform X2 n=1 Tax=Rhinichthys klamathensis goyatoka TaxID=3034132 RepID=UPI0024B5AB95|nr:protein RIC-3 isoform X2 [Rhinichthys klamathensis goyatoka]